MPRRIAYLIRLCVLCFLQRTQPDSFTGEPYFITIERARRRSGDHIAVFRKPRPVARTRKLPSRRIPPIGASQMCAPRRKSHQFAIGLLQNPCGFFCAVNLPAIGFVSTKRDFARCPNRHLLEFAGIYPSRSVGGFAPAEQINGG